MIALVVFGIAALSRLQTDEFPDIDAPIVFIGIVYPGASPDQVEREVVDRLEDRISGITGLDKLSSTSTRRLRADHRPVQVRQADRSGDAGRARRDLAPCARSCRRRSSSRSSSGSIRRRCRSSRSRSRRLTLTPAQLTQIADQTIGGELRAIAGVAQVNVAGADSATLNVDPRPDAPRGVGRRRRSGGDALRAQNLAAPVGQVTGPVDRARDPARGAARAPGGLRAAHRRAARRRARSARPGRHGARPAPPSGARPRCTTGARRSGSTS